MTGSSRWPGRWRIWRGRRKSGRSIWRRRFSIGCWTASFGSERLSGGLNYKKKSGRPTPSTPRILPEIFPIPSLLLTTVLILHFLCFFFYSLGFFFLLFF